MIRLYCLRQMLERLSAEEANAISLGNNDYLRLLRMVPSTMPTKNRYQMYQALMLSGITPMELRYVHPDVPPDRTLYRIKKYHTLPEAWCFNENVLLDGATYDRIIKDLWYQVISPLQIGAYPIEEPKPILKLFWIQKKVREQPWLMNKIVMSAYPETRHIIDVVKSLEKITTVDSLYEWDVEEFVYPRRRYYVHLDALDYYKWSNEHLLEYFEERKEHIDNLYNFYYANNAEIDILYSFLYRICCFGIANDMLISGEWDIQFYQ